ncbi:hypothetical protein CLV98_10120 [Dyadobacter jejuensis]|uniref:Uncharacterized protein n=1 Tax=Dyadobacter jejuensis TaxID=1082580 RepID=A0A316AR39_9BACT|nr:hypothetical protein CLV98_10120 [Dyadobacter jejuensis]
MYIYKKGMLQNSFKSYYVVYIIGILKGITAFYPIFFFRRNQ